MTSRAASAYNELMNYRTLSNVHNHTMFSDGKNTAEEMVQAALGLGFHTLGFSEHGPADYDDAAMPAERMADYCTEILRLREKYAGRIHILLGLEHDWLSPVVPDSLDYAIESVHYVQKDGQLWCVDWTREKQETAIRELYGGNPYALCRDYFRTVCASIEGTSADILGHIELVMKFNEARDLFDDADPRYLGPALACAELAAKSGLLIEINTGAMAKGYRTAPYPGAAMLRRISECGGRILLSSDCHDARLLNHSFGLAEALAKACGFRTAWEYRGAKQVEYLL